MQLINRQVRVGKIKPTEESCLSHGRDSDQIWHIIYLELYLFCLFSLFQYILCQRQE